MSHGETSLLKDDANPPPRNIKSILTRLTTSRRLLIIFVSLFSCKAASLPPPSSFSSISPLSPPATDRSLAVIDDNRRLRPLMSAGDLVQPSRRRRKQHSYRLTEFVRVQGEKQMERVRVEPVFFWPVLEAGSA